MPKVRRIKYHDSQTDKILVFLTNNFDIPALTVAELYRNRWKIELNLYTILQIFSVSLFEQIHILQLLTDTSLQTFDYDSRKQFNLFNL